MKQDIPKSESWQKSLGLTIGESFISYLEICWYAKLEEFLIHPAFKYLSVLHLEQEMSK